MIKKYQQFILEKNIEQTNEGFKDWVSVFMMLVNVGLVPLSVTTANAQTKKDFVEKVPQDKLDAAKFVSYINKLGTNNPVDKMWTDFITKNTDTKSKLKDVEKYLTKDGKVYHFDKKYQEQDFSNVDIHNIHPVNYLTDIGGFIDDSKEPEINNFIYDYAQKTSVEICIITVPSLGGEDPFQYSLDEFNKIKVGKKASNNGILIMVSMEDRKWEIRTGYGLEGLLPDIICSRIGQDIIIPNFKNKDYYSGLMGAVREIGKNIDKNPEDIKRFQKEQEEKESVHRRETWTDVGFAYLILAMISTLFILVRRKYRNVEDMMDVVSDKLEVIRKMKDKASRSGTIEVDLLYNKFMSIVNRNLSTINQVEGDSEKPKFYQIGKHVDFLINQKNRIKSIEGIHTEIQEAYQVWQDKKNRLDNIKSTVSNFNLSSIMSSIEVGFAAWNTLRDEYGVNVNYDSDVLKSKASQLDKLINDVDDAYNNSLSDAEKILNYYNLDEYSISQQTSSINQTLKTYKSAESMVNDWRSLIKKSVSNSRSYIRWAESGEEKDLQNIVDKISSDMSGYSKKNIMSAKSNLEKGLNDIDKIVRKWKDRKEEEEGERVRIRSIISQKEEDEKRRHEADERSSSSSSSSSFDGFGGGSSGGGGSGGSW